MAVVDEVLVKTLSGVVGKPLRYVVLCEVRPGSGTQFGETDDPADNRFYLCMGEHAFFILKPNMTTKLLADGGASYDKLDAMKKDQTNENRLKIILKEPVKDAKGKRDIKTLIIISYDRAGIMSRIQVYWQVHYMYTLWKVPTMEERNKMDGSEKMKAGSKEAGFFETAFKQTPDDEFTFSIMGYNFWADETFHQAQNKTHFRSKRYGRLAVNVRPLGNVEELQHSKFHSVKALADQEVRRISKLVEEYVIVDTPSWYHKKYNLTHDQAQWQAWRVHVRTGRKRDGLLDPKANKASTSAQRRDIIIIAARRKYIPPLMSNYQDIILVLYGKRFKASKAREGVTEKTVGYVAVEACSGIFDSLHTKALQDFEYDENVLQAKADALWFDEEASAHFQAKLALEPKARTAARKFVHSVLRILFSLLREQKYAFEDTDSSSSKRGESQGMENPFKHANTLRKNSRGLTQKSDKWHEERWKQRVWRYLAYCCDGNLPGLSPATISIVDTATQVYASASGPEHQAEQKMLAEVINWLLHFRLAGPRSVYKGEGVLEVYDRAGFMDEFQFNEIVMRRLLEAKYFSMFVFKDKSDSSSEKRQKYPGFLIRLLRQCCATPVRMAVTRELQAALCQQLLKLSQYTGQRGPATIRADVEIARLIVLPDIVKLLKKHDDDVIRTHLMATLVNMTYGNSDKKKELLKHDVPAIANLALKSQDPDLVRQSCMLLSNLTTFKTGRKAVSMVKEGGNVIVNLGRLLCDRDFPPKKRSVTVRYEAMKVLQNLSKEEDLHQTIEDSLNAYGVRSRSNTAGGVKGSFFLERLSKLLEVRKSKIGVDNPKVVPLLKVVCTCLTRLCYKHTERKGTVGSLCIVQLLRTLQEDICDNNVDLTIKILVLLCSLAFSRDNLPNFKMGDFDKVFRTLQNKRKGNLKQQKLVDLVINDIFRAHKCYAS